MAASPTAALSAPAAARIEPFFADWSTLDHPGRGRRFCLWHAPALSHPRGCVVQVHALAEEMNKCRRMAALQARALAENGYAVLQFDLFGCGDSDGDFGDSTWTQWIRDVQVATDKAAERWSRDWPQHPVPRPVLWAQRAGALLASAAAADAGLPCDFLFWQPSTSGKLVLQQLLRLKLAAALDGAQAKVLGEALRAGIAAGQTTEIAGYRVSADLARGLEAAVLAPGSTGVGGAALHWLETHSRDPATLLPASLSSLERWRSAGYVVRAEAVSGPPFWSTVEITEAPELVSASLAMLEGRPLPAARADVAALAENAA
ncbi:MAG: hydrolase 2, exosortase A system-associated [Rubrivivax sp.]|jgi:exosortase A-associated hydrolase 2|nr:hydrolase 2, exosortase A system-associated [Rubrivivax sp.]